MVEDDVQLIRKILSGDSKAFTALVRKHQKGVHALAWRFSSCRRYYPRHLCSSIQAPPKTKGPQSVFWLALCHHESTL